MRSGLPLARWLSLGQMLDIAASERFFVSRLLRGDRTRDPSAANVSLQRRRRVVRRVDHQAVAFRLEQAIQTGERLSQIAGDLGVSVGTLARHVDLYDAVTDTREYEQHARHTARRATAIQQAERRIIHSMRIRRTPILRTAGTITGDRWHIGQLRSVTLTRVAEHGSGGRRGSTCSPSCSGPTSACFSAASRRGAPRAWTRSRRCGMSDAGMSGRKRHR
jgi:AraC-like DNA-binding protein